MATVLDTRKNLPANKVLATWYYRETPSNDRAETENALTDSAGNPAGITKFRWIFCAVGRKVYGRVHEG